MSKWFMMIPFAFIGVIGLAGCSNNSGPHGGHGRSWYAAHSKADGAEVYWCEKNPLKRYKLDSCKNALAGYQDLMLKKYG